MSIENDKIVETTLLDTHQSFNNGGISMDVVRTEHSYEINGQETNSIRFALKVSMSNYGLRQETSIPLTPDSVEVLEEILEVLKKSDVGRSYDYINPHLFITYEDGTSKYEYETTFGQVGSDQDQSPE
jgi:hypothetical protein